MSEAFNPEQGSEPIETTPEPTATHSASEGWSSEQLAAANAVNVDSIGHPETVSGYDLSSIALHETMPWDDGFQSRMVDSMHQLGLTNAQVNGIIQKYIADQGGTYETMVDDVEGRRETAMADLQSEWGTG